MTKLIIGLAAFVLLAAGGALAGGAISDDSSGFTTTGTTTNETTTAETQTTPTVGTTTGEDIAVRAICQVKQDLLPLRHDQRLLDPFQVLNNPE